MPEQNNSFIVAAFAVTWISIIAYGLRLRRARTAAERRAAHARATLGGAR